MAQLQQTLVGRTYYSVIPFVFIIHPC